MLNKDIFSWYYIFTELGFLGCMAIWQLFQKVVPTPRTTSGGGGGGWDHFCNKNAAHKKHVVTQTFIVHKWSVTMTDHLKKKKKIQKRVQPGGGGGWGWTHFWKNGQWPSLITLKKKIWKWVLPRGGGWTHFGKNGQWPSLIIKKKKKFESGSYLGRGEGLDPLWEKWPEMISDAHWPFFPKWVQPPPPAAKTHFTHTDGRTYRLMVITLSMWYTALRATTRLKMVRNDHWSLCDHFPKKNFGTTFGCAGGGGAVGTTLSKMIRDDHWSILKWFEWLLKKCSVSEIWAKNKHLFYWIDRQMTFSSSHSTLNTVWNGLNFGEKQDMAIWKLVWKVVPTPRTTSGGGGPLLQKWSGMITDHVPKKFLKSGPNPDHWPSLTILN